MTLAVVGLSHQTSAVEVRERLHFSEESVRGALLQLRKHLGAAGVVILSTCNRVELYAHRTENPETLCDEIRAFLSEYHSIPEADLTQALYEHTGRNAVAHLFRVASSLDSLVVGEGQILGQVHDAFIAAQASQSTDKVIQALFQRAFSVAKDVRTHTSIGAGKVSIASVAVDLAASIFMDLADKCVMVIGSGKMGETTLKSLMARGVGEILLVNRSIEKAETLAETVHGEALALDDLSTQLHRADIIITSTAAKDFVLRPEHFHTALRERSHQPVFVIDIAVPRDVDPAVAAIDDVYLYDVDALQEVANENLEARRKEVDASMCIVETGTERFEAWRQSLLAEPTIVSMAEELNAIRERELEKTLGSLPDLSPEQREEVTYLTKRIVNTILQRPMSQIKREVGQHNDPHTVLGLVKRLFGLKEMP